VPAAYTDDLNQTATYWAPSTLDAFGHPAFGSPITLACRWQQKHTLAKGQGNREIVSDTTVYVDQELGTQGWLALDDQTGTADPRTLAGAREILAVAQSPDLDNDEVLHKALL
jgi:hypothetical protein